MQEYIYGNIGHKSFEYLSSDPNYFKDARRIEKMNPILTYDTSCRHGSLPSEAHQCCWMLTSDLNLSDEAERLFLQASGVDPYRSSIYVCGYMSDAEDPYLYGPALLKLLRTKFPTINEKTAEGALTRRQADALPSYSREELPAVKLEPELLRCVLLALMQDKRVIVRLPGEGADAMAQSRAFLLAVYERLPYDQRRHCGFFTGASASQLANLDSFMPDTVRLILTDGDTELGEISEDRYQAVFDLKNPAYIPPMVREKNGKVMSYVGLIDFLVRKTPEQLDEFFSFCRRIMSDEDESVAPTMANYSLLLDFFENKIGKGEGASMDDQIRSWAAALYPNRLPDRVKQVLFERIASLVSEEQLTDYLVRASDSFSDLAKLGVLDREEKTWITDSQYAAGDVKDRNQALTLRLGDNLSRYYPDPRQSHLQIVQKLARHFLDLAYRDCPSLGASQPTGEDVTRLNSLELNPADGQGWAAEIRGAVCQTLRKVRTQVLQVYENRMEQLGKWGLEQIAAWAKGRDYRTAPAPDTLYQKLEEAYLCRELLDSSCPRGWNQALARKFVSLCTEPKPVTYEDYEQNFRFVQGCMDCFEGHGGVFTEDQRNQLVQLLSSWSQVQQLLQKGCSGIKELLACFGRLDGLRLSNKALDSVKNQLAAGLAVSPGETLSHAEQICSLARESTLNRDILHGLLSSTCTLWRIPADRKLPDIRSDIQNIRDLSKNLQLSEFVWFGPWSVTCSCTELIREMRSLQEYRPGQQKPRLISCSEKLWAARNLQSCTDLMYLLASEYPWVGSEIIPVLAQQMTAVTGKELRTLYFAGWSREILEAGAGENTTPQWAEAVRGLFPLWQELPERPASKHGREASAGWILTAEPILVGLAAMSPAIILAATGTVSLLAYLITAAVLLGLAVCFLLCSLFLHSGNQKLLLRLTALALTIGMLLTVILMILFVL